MGTAVCPNLLCPFLPVAQIRVLLRAPGQLRAFSIEQSSRTKSIYLDPLGPVPLVMLRRRDKMVLKLLAMTAVAVKISGRLTDTFAVDVELH